MPDVPPTPEVPPESESGSARFPDIHALAGRGTPLSRDAYLTHFREEYPHSPLIDKLEVRQDFREPGYAPWEASRIARRDAASTRRARRFHQLVDERYVAATGPDSGIE